MARQQILGRLLILVATIFLTGCNTALSHLSLLDDKPQEQPGFPYYLPKQSYSITVTYEITNCAKSELSVDQSATVVENNLPDESQHFIVPYEQLSSLLKTSTFTGSTYPNGTLKSIGATIDDRSAAVIKSIVGTAVSMGKIAIATPTSDAETVCKSIIPTLIAQAKEARDDIATASDEKARAQAVAKLQAALNILQIKRTYTFEPSMTKHEETFSLPHASLKQWFSDPKILLDTDIALNGPLSKTLKTLVSVDPKPKAYPPQTNVASGQGISWRQPRIVAVKVYKGDKAAEELRMTAFATQIAQLGRFMTATLKNGMFDKDNVTLNFAANGQLESIQYGNESSLERATASLADTASQAEGFYSKLTAAQLAQANAADNEELSRINAELAMTKAKADLIEQQQRLQKLGGK